MIKLRFAPSPTGYLHVGNVRTALINWLFAKKTGGEFLLRIDDTDTSRSKDEYEQAIYEDMTWLGLDWSELHHQSRRTHLYEQAVEQLKASGRLYPCFETPEELEVKRKMLMSRGLPPVYDRAALKLSAGEISELSAKTPPAWRFKLDDEEIIWNDLVRGEVKFNPTTMSDPILIRADGVLLYTLASVVDDGDMDITHVVRGEDHVSNTAVQTQLYRALGLNVPQFAHTALLKTKEGELSKRTGGGDIRSLRQKGILPMAITSMLAKIGTSDAIEIAPDMQALIDDFDFSKFSRSPSNFDEAELVKLNEKLLRSLPYDAVKAQVGTHIDENFWHSVRDNINSLADVEMWNTMINAENIAVIHEDDREFLAKAAELLPDDPWEEHVWDVWLSRIKEHTDRKGKQLFMPLRLALTGMEHGPELKQLLPLLGREKTLERLKYAHKLAGNKHNAS